MSQYQLSNYPVNFAPLVTFTNYNNNGNKIKAIIFQIHLGIHAIN